MILVATFREKLSPFGLPDGRKCLTPPQGTRRENDITGTWISADCDL
ncbi:hypothetical protein SXCC_00336 [Gluconacetobacter sp. SXCC-1]|nr:hypothetical protein SXCC_00336 [Gluconacetobacter sp. SXCC-1]